MYTKVCPTALWPFLVLLLSVPGAHLAKCPKQCVCDQIQLTVTCVGKNLTEVPPTIDEVSDSHTCLYIFCISITLL